MYKLVLAAAGGISIFLSAIAFAAPPLDAYGALAGYRSVAVSPSGNRVAYLRREGDFEYAAVFDFTTGGTIAAARIDDVKVQSVFFVSDDFAILRASETTRTLGFRGEYEFSAALSWELSTNKVQQLLRRDEDLFPAQTGLGRIVGVSAAEEAVFMPAYIGGPYSDPDYNILKVSLKSGRARSHAKGNTHTIDWLVDKNGEVIAREDFNDKRNIYSIWRYSGGTRERIFEAESEIRPISLLGTAPNSNGLIVSIRNGKEARRSIAELYPDGRVSDPLFERDDADVERVLTDDNRVVYGVEYSGMKPFYEFFDSGLTGLIAGIAEAYPNAAVRVDDWNDGFEHMILNVAGGDTPPQYLLLNTRERTVAVIAKEYDQIPDSEVAPQYTIEYKARDNARIPALLTIPPGGEISKKRPTIIMPHGGPESYDAVGFDWLAQYFASRGYAVIQPNFRGSDGFGRNFRLAGRGEWGRGVMQHDVTDAVDAAIQFGIADPQKICIVGASYGGYAALAGGAFTSDLYKCIGAIAPVTDLPQMIYDERFESGSDSWVVYYWTQLIGDVRKEKDRLEEISPVNYAENFKAPVLLIHGNDDTVVPYKQSSAMYNALRRADKPVELIKVRGGDHWLSTSETRLETLRALEGFIAEHLGENGAHPRN